jgi:hypothetical protein
VGGSHEASDRRRPAPERCTHRAAQGPLGVIDG